MKNKTAIYSKALAEAILGKKAGEKQIIKNFTGILVKNGLSIKAKEILDLAEDIILKKQGGRKVVFETARKLSAGHKKMLEKFLEKKDIAEEKVDPVLVAGVKIIVNGEKQLDMTMLKKINNLFG